MKRLVAVTQIPAKELERQIHYAKFGNFYAMYHLLRDCMINNKITSVVSRMSSTFDVHSFVNMASAGWENLQTSKNAYNQPVAPNAAAQRVRKKDEIYRNYAPIYARNPSQQQRMTNRFLQGRPPLSKYPSTTRSNRGYTVVLPSINRSLVGQKNSEADNFRQPPTSSTVNRTNQRAKSKSSDEPVTKGPARVQTPDETTSSSDVNVLSRGISKLNFRNYQRKQTGIDTSLEAPPEMKGSSNVHEKIVSWSTDTKQAGDSHENGSNSDQQYVLRRAYGDQPPEREQPIVRILIPEQSDFKDGFDKGRRGSRPLPPLVLKQAKERFKPAERRPRFIRKIEERHGMPFTTTSSPPPSQEDSGIEPKTLESGTTDPSDTSKYKNVKTRELECDNSGDLSQTPVHSEKVADRLSRSRHLQLIPTIETPGSISTQSSEPRTMNPDEDSETPLHNGINVLKRYVVVPSKFQKCYPNDWESKGVVVNRTPSKTGPVRFRPVNSFETKQQQQQQQRLTNTRRLDRSWNASSIGSGNRNEKLDTGDKTIGRKTDTRLHPSGSNLVSDNSSSFIAATGYAATNDRSPNRTSWTFNNSQRNNKNRLNIRSNSNNVNDFYYNSSSSSNSFANRINRGIHRTIQPWTLSTSRGGFPKRKESVCSNYSARRKESFSEDISSILNEKQDTVSRGVGHSYQAQRPKKKNPQN